jgi:arylsulfatase A-like enzyme
MPGIDRFHPQAREKMRSMLLHALSGAYITLALALGAERPPNIVLILADDLGYASLGCYGNTEVKTPNIDRLAAEGMKFTDFHSNGAMCTPTRAALMTGRYQQRCTWVPDEELSPVFREQRRKNPVQRWAWGLSAQETTLPALLRGAGYRTALIGKWHLGYDLKFHPMNYGFDVFRGFIGGNVDYHTHIAGYGKKELDWWHDREIRKEEGYSTDLLTQHARAFITQNKTTPFFLYLAHAAPHNPWQSRDPHKKPSPVADYKEMIAVLDESVGAVIDTLRAEQIEHHTLVIFCSDNGPQAPSGFAANGPLRGKKGSMEEGGHRVPMIARWPGVIAPGTTSDATALTMDLLPTFAQGAGATIPPNHQIDGTDLMPVFRKAAAWPERTFHWQHGHAWAVRQGPWKLTGQGTQTKTLIHLSEDLSESKNLHSTHPDRVSALHKLHQQWVKEVGAR